MLRIAAVALVAAVGCADEDDTAHNLGTCDAAWTQNDQSPSQCELACTAPPAQSLPYDPSCTICKRPFVADDGRLGCCEVDGPITGYFKIRWLECE